MQAASSATMWATAHGPEVSIRWRTVFIAPQVGSPPKGSFWRARDLYGEISRPYRQLLVRADRERVVCLEKADDLPCEDSVARLIDVLEIVWQREARISQ